MFCFDLLKVSKIAILNTFVDNSMLEKQGNMYGMYMIENNVGF